MTGLDQFGSFLHKRMEHLDISITWMYAKFEASLDIRKIIALLGMADIGYKKFGPW